MKKHKFSYHVRIIVVISSCLFALIGGGLFTYYMDTKLTNTFVDTYTLQQQKAVDRVVRHMKEAYEGKKDKQEASVVFQAYIEEEVSDSDTYWFLYTKDEVLFERDRMQSDLLEGKNLETLIQEWTNKGGVNTHLVNDLFQGKITNLIFSKDAAANKELVNVQRINMGEQTYYIGSASSLSYLLEANGYDVDRMLLFVFIAILECVILVFTIFLLRSMSASKAQEQSMKELVHAHNSELTRVDQELKERRKQVKDYQVLDPLALFYNREYFYTLLLNMTRQNLKSLGMVVIEITSLHNMIAQYGLEYEQGTLTSIKQCVEGTFQNENVVARVCENRIVVTLLNDDYREMSQACAWLEEKIKELKLPNKVMVYSVVQMRQESPMDMYKRIDQIIKSS